MGAAVVCGPPGAETAAGAAFAAPPAWPALNAALPGVMGVAGVGASASGAGSAGAGTVAAAAFFFCAAAWRGLDVSVRSQSLEGKIALPCSSHSWTPSSWEPAWSLVTASGAEGSPAGRAAEVMMSGYSRC